MQHITRGRLLAAGTAITIAFGGAAVTAATSLGESAVPQDPRAKLFSQPVDLIVDIKDLPRIYAEMEADPKKYDNMNIGVDTRSVQMTPELQAAKDATLAQAQEAAR